ncbi:helix-turn-helix domain-containing protein [Mesorhizobium wenxiniae]|uniref:Uncharacterized protein n=1 Tax=Mesorhizobium wenxiniae TaxID=2014805 RepID=A0A271KHL1_9HYPH|nr:helix-turn-helix domain-containing protein [Mesorhizobium wenxiniae]PAP94505.1 hypothetical protein CIT31_16025 [Mesorhizobium wenxiniae]
MKGKNPPGEHFTKIIRHTHEWPAWRALSSSAQAAYPWFKFEWRGTDKNNNGKLRLSVRQLAQRMGVRPDTAAEAIRELQRKGYLFQTESACLGVDGAAKSPAWELTELKLPGTDKTQDGRKLYREWQPGKDYPVQAAGANNPRGENGRRTKPRHENRDGPVLISVTKNRVAS